MPAALSGCCNSLFDGLMQVLVCNTCVEFTALRPGFPLNDGHAGLGH